MVCVQTGGMTPQVYSRENVTLFSYSILLMAFLWLWPINWRRLNSINSEEKKTYICPFESIENNWNLVGDALKSIPLKLCGLCFHYPCENRKSRYRIQNICFLIEIKSSCWVESFPFFSTESKIVDPFCISLLLTIIHNSFETFFSQTRKKTTLRTEREWVKRTKYALAELVFWRLI